MGTIFKGNIVLMHRLQRLHGSAHRQPAKTDTLTHSLSLCVCVYIQMKINWVRAALVDLTVVFENCHVKEMRLHHILLQTCSSQIIMIDPIQSANQWRSELRAEFPIRLCRTTN